MNDSNNRAAEPDIFEVLLHPDKYIEVTDCECGHTHYEEAVS